MKRAPWWKCWVPLAICFQAVALVPGNGWWLVFACVGTAVVAAVITMEPVRWWWQVGRAALLLTGIVASGWLVFLGVLGRGFLDVRPRYLFMDGKWAELAAAEVGIVRCYLLAGIVLAVVVAVARWRVCWNRSLIVPVLFAVECVFAREGPATLFVTGHSTLGDALVWAIRWTGAATVTITLAALIPAGPAGNRAGVDG